jgi:hypothetical protein
MRNALIFNTAPMMSVSIKTRANCAWSVVMQRFPNLHPGQLSLSIDGLSCGHDNSDCPGCVNMRQRA